MKDLSVKLVGMKVTPVNPIEATLVAILEATLVAPERASVRVPSVARMQTMHPDFGRPVADRPRGSGLIGPITSYKSLVRLDD
jgi:hypothetical protein